MPTALVTGASTGIGAELAKCFAADGYDLVLVARRPDALDEVARTLAGPRPAIVAIDLAQRHSASSLVAELNRRGLTIDVVVNNAGFGLQGTVAELPLDRQLEMIQLNVTTLVELTRLLLPDLRRRPGTGVLNVASTAAFQPGPLMAVYFATKAFVLSFTEALAEEVAGSGMNVSCLCPGPTHTEFAARAGIETTGLFRGPVMSAERVAQAGYAGWKRGEVVVVPGALNRRGALMVRLAPRAMVRRIVRRLNSKHVS